MPPKRKAPEGEDSSSSKVVGEFSKLLKEHAKVHGEQIQQLLRMHNAGRGREREQVRPEPGSEGAYERFRKMKPPEFEGSTDPMVALEWVKGVEAIYDYLQFDDKDRRSEIAMVEQGTIARLSALVIRTTLTDRIRREQPNDNQLMKLRSKADEKGNTEFAMNTDDLLTFRGRICVPSGDDIRRDVLAEAHTALYSIHPGSTKTYQDLRRLYWWPGMKSDIAKFISECLTCQQVKIEHQRPAGTLKSLPIPQWKWEHITMDFVTGLPRTSKGYNSIWLIVDRLTKSAHFLPVKMTFTMNQYAEAYVAEIVRLHGIPVSIDRMKTAQTRQKSYADNRRRPLEFEVGDHVFVKIAPLKGIMRFGRKGKLSPRFIGPFEILDRIGERAYRIALPPDLDRVHNVFHVSMLRKYISNPSPVLKHEALDLMPNLTYQELPIQILDRKVKVLRNKEIGIIKNLWRNQLVEEATWEPEEEMKQRYPELFVQ
ncbi:uncharacterized protein [Primulina eburnea]|uniref:uncharacterized protein n=1 Tax=Primulina eburnea TaxID=1245227 RepID=UPI003C6C7BEC